MLDAPFTEAEVKYLLRGKKYIYSVIKDTTADRDAPAMEVVYRVRRHKDKPENDISLRFWAKRVRPILDTGPKPRPSASLKWRGQRIRGIDHKIVHPKIKNGFVIGQIRGWHEHQYNQTDGDKHVVDINKAMKRCQLDFRSFIRFCLERWNIQLKKDENRQQLLNHLWE